ncbi:hypothetical protein TDB9533_00864 [Thalassocella blandensis]|nr:hypothetical protein TDB9533_00864 [Thalassocella blandensis]
MNFICAFSSDRRELYKADIYRVLALPKGHIVHFRYKTKYVDDNLLVDIEKLLKQKVAIFFTHGNSSEGENNSCQNFSIRYAIITKVEISDVTDVFHIYMKLSEFCSVDVDSNNSQEKIPPTKFFTRLNCTEKSNDKNWHSRVLAIKDYFPRITFFHLKEINDGYQENKIHYQNDGKSCYYNLIHGNRYILKLSISNPDTSNTKIEISDSSDEITFNCINPFESSIQFDDHDVPISVKTLQVFKQASLLRFKPIQSTTEPGDYDVLGEYSTNIELNLELSLKRPLIFGLFSTMAFWAVLMVRPISDSASWPSCWTLVLATVFFYMASSSLFFGLIKSKESYNKRYHADQLSVGAPKCPM